MAEPISIDATSFSKSLLAMAVQVEGDMEKIIRKTCIDLYTRIVKRTPRDSGRAAASWGLSIGGGPPATLPPEEGWPKPEFSESVRNANITKYAGQEIGGFSFDIHDNQIIITNNLEYIEYLEAGTSQQAPGPGAMVAVSMAEFDDIFRQNLKGMEGFESA